MLIAGFVAPDSGRLLLGEQDISAVPPHLRDIGVVFQNYALFPHLDVRRNVAFPLEVRGARSAETQRQVDWALKLVHMETSMPAGASRSFPAASSSASPWPAPSSSVPAPC